MLFFHLTKDKLTTIHCSMGDVCDFKPEGAFWMAPGNEWVNFEARRSAWTDQETKQNIKSVRRNNNFYEVDVDMENVLVVDDEDDARQVFEQYGHMIETSFGDEVEVIDWMKLSKDFDGIFINFTPMSHYSPERDPGLGWLSGWDISSIAIWNESMVRGITLVDEDHDPDDDGTDPNKATQPASKRLLKGGTMFLSKLFGRKTETAVEPVVESRQTAEQGIADEVAVRRINSEGSRPRAWKSIRKELGLGNTEFHKGIRLSPEWKIAVCSRISELQKQDGGWEYNGKLSVLTGIEGFTMEMVDSFDQID